MAFPLIVVFGNFPIFAPLIKKIMAKIPQAAAMLSTGLTFPSFFAGNEDLPQMKAKEASACLYLRCIREETLRRELAQIKEIATEYGIEIQEVLRDYCEPSSFESRPYRVLEELLRRNFPDVITAPFLLTAGTDARRFTGLSNSILRFAPIDLSKEQFASIHNKNENITIQNIGQCVIFYKDFIKTI
jgi:carboxypeptidase PM20D1